MKYRVLKTSLEKLEVDLGEADTDGYKPVFFLNNDASINPYLVILKKDRDVEAESEARLFVEKGSDIDMIRLSEFGGMLSRDRFEDPKIENSKVKKSSTDMKTVLAWLLLGIMTLILFQTYKG